jgi:hypothetical protein
LAYEASKDGNQLASSKNSLEVPIDPIISLKTKRIQEKLFGLILNI